MLTSGSTSLPKAVIQTQRMLGVEPRPGPPGAGADRGLERRDARLAAVEPRLRRLHADGHADQRRHALHRRRATDAGPVRRVAAQPQGSRAEVLRQRAVRLRDAGRRAREGRGAAPALLRQRAPRAVRRRRPAAGAVRPLPAARRRDRRRAHLLHHRLRRDRNLLGLHGDLLPDRGGRHRPADARPDAEAGAERAALRSAVARADDHARLPRQRRTRIAASSTTRASTAPATPRSSTIRRTSARA